MQFSSRTEYAVRIMLDLASQPKNRLVSSKDIAKRQDLPAKFLAQIIGDLRRVGLVQTNRGPQGGACLLRPSPEITIREIIEAIEGPIALYRCLLDRGHCKRQSHCPLCGVWVKTQKEMLNVLERTTLEDLVKGRVEYESDAGSDSSLAL